MGDYLGEILGLVAILISAVAGWATHKSAQRAQERNTTLTSRTDIEKEAFSRAEAFYKNSMERQDKEIARQDAEIAECHEENRVLKAEVVKLEGRVKSLEDELSTAQAALRIRYPDE